MFMGGVTADSNIDNSTVLSRQFAQGNLAPNIAYGATQTRGFSDSGTQTTSFPDGEFAAVPNSSYPFTPTLGQDFTGRLGTMVSQSRTQSETYANLAQQSTSSALTRFSEIRNAYSQGQSSDTVSGVGTTYGSSNTVTVEVTLTVTDCMGAEGEDTVDLAYTCKGS